MTHMRTCPSCGFPVECRNRTDVCPKCDEDLIRAQARKPLVIDLAHRGETVSQALAKLDAAVSECLWHGHPALKVIHGHGSGGGASRTKPQVLAALLKHVDRLGMTCCGLRFPETHQPRHHPPPFSHRPDAHPSGAEDVSGTSVGIPLWIILVATGTAGEARGMEVYRNLLTIPNAPGTSETIEPILTHPAFMLEHIVSHGAASPEGTDRTRRCPRSSSANLRWSTP